MGGKSGGGFDAGPSIEYGNKALALQEQMYDDSVERTQPYYDVGTGGLGMLADMLGINGGTKQSRSQIRDELMPEYTTQGSAPMSDMFVDPNTGAVLSAKGVMNAQTSPNVSGRRTPLGMLLSDPEANAQKINDMITSWGYESVGGTQGTESSVDYDGLNAAIDERLAGQETPDNFGSLLESFSLDKFQEDPGYQFRLDEGNKAIERAAAARGQYYDPSTVKALNDYNTNTADLTYQDAYNRYNNDQTNIFNRLAAVAGIGQTANNSLNAAGANNAAAAGNIYGQMGSAAQAAANANASQPSMFDTLLGVGMGVGSAGSGSIFGKVFGL